MAIHESKCFKVSDTGFCMAGRSNAIIKNGFAKNRKQQYL